MDSNSEERQSVVRAFAIATSSCASNSERREAFDMLESFKQNPDKCLNMGSILIQTADLNHRLLGFELLQSFVLHSWNCNDWNIDTLKAKFKCEMLLFLRKAAGSADDEEVLTRNSIAKLFVLLALNEFPQMWPELLPELYSILSAADCKKLTVLSIFERIGEELVFAPTAAIPNHRVKDIRQFLLRDGNLSPLIEFFSGHLRQYNSDTGDPIPGFADLMSSILKCLHQFIGWVPLALISENVLREQLLCLLTCGKLRLFAVDCLVTFLMRKGSDTNERAFLLSLFKINSLSYLRKAAESSLRVAEAKDNYVFLKKMIELYARMNEVYCNIQTKFENELTSIMSDEYFMFLENLFLFHDVPSHLLNFELLNIVLNNLKTVSKNPQKETYVPFLPKIYHLAVFVLTKIGFPSKGNHPSCYFSKIDFDDDLEFGSFVGQMRSGGCELIRQMFDYNFTATSRIILSDFSEDLHAWSQGDYKDNSFCLSIESKSLALTTFLSKMCLTEPNDQLITVSEQLHAIFTFCIQDCEHEQNCVVLNSLLSVVSSLFHFWFEHQQTFVRVVKLIFNCLYFQVQNADDRKSAYLVHRHASSLFLSKTVEHYDLFVSFYDDFSPILWQCFQDTQVDKGCRSAILESLVVLTAHVPEPSRTETLMNLLQLPIESLKSHVELHLKDIGTLLRLLDLQTFKDSFTQWEVMIEFKFATTSISGYLRRLLNFIYHKPSSDCNAASDDSLSNFAVSAVNLVAPSIMKAVRVFHELHSPEVKASFCDELKSALELSEPDRRNLLGIQQALVEASESSEKTPLHRIQNYIKEVHNNLIQALSACVLLYVSEIDREPSLAQDFMLTFFHNLDSLSNVFVGSIIKFFLGPLKDKCPEQYHESILVPTLKQSYALLFRRLSKDWITFSDKNACQNDSDKDTDEEVLEDLFLRRNTRALLHIIEQVSIVALNQEDTCKSEQQGSDAAENDSEMKDASVRFRCAIIPSALQPRQELKPFAHLMFQDDSFYETVLLLMLNAFIWPDTASSTKAVNIFWPLFQPTIRKEPPADVIKLVFTQLLKGYQLNEYSTASSALLLTLIFKFYVSLRPRYQVIRQILQEVPEINVKVLDEFESKLFQSYTEGQDLQVEKKMKDCLRNILKGIVGRPLSSMYHQGINVRELPKLQPSFKKEPRSLDYTEDVNLEHFFTSQK